MDIASPVIEIRLQSLLRTTQVEIHDPLASHLMGGEDESHFSLRLIDAVRLSGHACRSVTSAFLIAMAAKQALFGEKPLERGLVSIRVAGPEPTGALGPMSQVLSYITGAWGPTGFGGLQGKFSRKNLLIFDAEIRSGDFEFTRIDTGQKVVVRAHTENIPPGQPNRDFRYAWREHVLYMLEHPEDIVRVSIVPKNEASIKNKAAS